MANIREHATIRVTRNDYIVSISKNYIRLQKSLPINKHTKEDAVRVAEEFEVLVAEAPANKFECAYYLMRNGGLPYYAGYTNWITPKDDYGKWVLDQTRIRLCGCTW